MATIIEDVKQAVNEIAEAVQEGKKASEARLEALEGALRQLEAKAGRERLGLGGGGLAANAEVKAFETWARTGELERKAMSGTASPDGGYLLNAEMDKQITSVAASMGAIRQVARVVPASSGDFQIPVATNFAGSAWLNETASRATTATPTLSMVRPTSGGIAAVAPVTNWLLNDSGYNVTQFITENVGKAFGIAEGAAFISGDAVNKPSGILSYTLATTADSSRTFGQLQKVKSGTSGSFDADDLVDLLYALAPQYRARAAFVMNPSTIATVRKFKASTSGDYIWEASAAAGQPSTLFGVPVYEDPNMPVVAASASAVLCGDFQAGYVITDIGGLLAVRDQVTSKGNTLFYVERRVGGAVADSNAIKVLTLEV